ncbi:C6 transcription factor OefC [Metarhizium acridum CQMa 102]|uniref:C6 transcription factor OefC n=1 Tax=Metarhizium acridum (strain CQMa 102) TaxID=655827 RepID=E9E5T6_METAQ|nr:C6 transcription factor OefC [Metarhizium acridum CQMa 102]EFY88799.1 C6 transcription factor OefC [Metarhizium acridum CQMa 102]
MSALAVSPEAAPAPVPQAQNVAQRKTSKKGGYTRQRRGCLTCRQRKKKCDQGLPICGHCSRLNLVCARERPRQLSSSWGAVQDRPHWGSGNPCCLSQGDHVSEVLRLASIPEPLDLLHPDDAVGRDLSASRRTMMRYYTSTLAVMLSATAENNCFLSVLLPMAFDCPTLLDAMAAWASSHLALREPSFRDTSLLHRGRVLANLGAALKDGSLSGEMCLAVAMAMCSMETISDATSSSWAHHLSGAAAALQPGSSGMQLSPPRTSASVLSGDWLKSVEGRWLVRNFAYHDILMSVSLDRRPLMTGDYWMSADDAMADPYFAFASRIMLSTSEISVLNADCAEYYEASLGGGGSNTSGLALDPNCDALLQRALGIASDLREWQCPAASTDTPLTSLSETYRSAGLIYLNRVVRKYLPQHATDVLPEGIRVYVDSVCEVAEKVPGGSLAECSLLFPLFMAGGEAEEATHMERIRSRLCTMNKWRRFRNVDACREVLEEVWEQREEWRRGMRRDKVDWRDVVEQRGWQLALS